MPYKLKRILVNNKCLTNCLMETPVAMISLFVFSGSTRFVSDTYVSVYMQRCYGLIKQSRQHALIKNTKLWLDMLSANASINKFDYLPAIMIGYLKKNVIHWNFSSLQNCFLIKVSSLFKALLWIRMNNKGRNRQRFPELPRKNLN